MNRRVTLRERHIKVASLILLASASAAVLLVVVLIVPEIMRSPQSEAGQLQCNCPYIKPLLTGRIFTDNPAWSSDGMLIAFEKAEMDLGYRLEATSEIHIIKPDGTDLQQLTDNDIEDTHPSWAPDNQHLVYASKTKANDAYLSELNLETNVARVIFDCAYFCIDPTWSPDGQWIAFQVSTALPPKGVWELWILDTTTWVAKKLLSLGNSSSGLTWSPDSRQILFAPQGLGTEQIMSLAIDGSSAADILAITGSAIYPTGYPINDVFAFVRNDITSGKQPVDMIFLYRNNGKNIEPLISNLTSGRMYSPAISPDRKRLAFIYSLHGSYDELYVADLSQK